jgi:hypothetical protein
MSYLFVPRQNPTCSAVLRCGKERWDFIFFSQDGGSDPPSCYLSMILMHVWKEDVVGYIWMGSHYG